MVVKGLTPISLTREDVKVYNYCSKCKFPQFTLLLKLKFGEPGNDVCTVVYMIQKT